MKKEKKDEQFLKKPFYKGGDAALRAFIASELKYPESARLLGISGSVPLRYDINHKGEVVQVHLISSLHPDCDAEAIRVVKLLRFEVPKTPRNLRVIFHKNIRIHFHLNAGPQVDFPATGQAGELQIQYNYLPIMKTDPTPEKPAPQGGYSYTLNIGPANN